MVTPALFARVSRPPRRSRGASQPDVEEIIKSTGFFRNKTRSLIGMAQALVADHGGEVPRTMEELRTLPGVGRKTANVILGNAYGINEGITVDTHVTRLSRLLGLTRHDDPVKIEQDLMPLFPAGPLGAALAPADLPRATGLHRPAAEMRRVRAIRHLSVLDSSKLSPGKEFAVWAVGRHDSLRIPASILPMALPTPPRAG